MAWRKDDEGKERREDLTILFKHVIPRNFHEGICNALDKSFF
jgi:hypothetical protein